MGLCERCLKSDYLSCLSSNFQIKARCIFFSETVVPENSETLATICTPLFIESTRWNKTKMAYLTALTETYFMWYMMSKTIMCLKWNWQKSMPTDAFTDARKVIDHMIQYLDYYTILKLCRCRILIFKSSPTKLKCSSAWFKKAGKISITWGH